MRQGLVGAVCLALVFGGCKTGENQPPEFPDATIHFDAGRIDGGTASGDAARQPDAAPDTCGTAVAAIGHSCMTSSDCDDGCFCNGHELCTMGVCVAGADPCASTVTCVHSACVEETDMCFKMPDSASCQDSDLCNGTERCDMMNGCVHGSPLYCNDDVACTIDACDPTMGCTFTLRDLDMDGHVDGRCGGDDCNDDPHTGAHVYPGATEICDNRQDDDCNGLRDFADPSCMPHNDTCDVATVISGAGTFSGSTSGLHADYPVTCSTMVGPDAVFKLTLTEPHDVQIATSATGRVTAIAVRPFAACSTAGSDDKCASGNPPTLLRRSLPAGDWAIIVKTQTATPFDLIVTFNDPTPIPLYDVCNASTVDISAGGHFTGNFVETADNYTLSCNATPSRDAAYKLVLTAPSDVMLTASVDVGARTAYLSLVTDCTMPSTTLLCLGNSAPTLFRREVPAGTYYVLLESNAADATAWTLNATITTPPAPRNPGDACSSAMMVLDGTSVPVDGAPHAGTAMVNLATTEFDYGTSCGGGAAPSRDSVFYFDVPTGGADVRLDSSGFGLHYQALETSCGVRTSEVGCHSGSGTVSHSWRSLAAGRYYVVVSTNNTTGTGALTVTMTRPPTVVPANDSCGGPTVLNLTSPVTVMGDLTGYQDDVAGCSGSSLTDVIYTFTLTGTHDLNIIATRLSGSGNITLTLRGTCGTLSTPNGCVSAASPTALSPAGLPAGTYYLIVEMAAGQEGMYRLSVQQF